ncbi:MAG TPA: hypothetical protein VIN08_14070 [Ohtaekwangia sp.]|uniref:hypothetical protein n=1 Tax=Ohtaekwangia sp. TaxID=2066019 RepID=UPI002F95927E
MFQKCNSTDMYMAVQPGGRPASRYRAEWPVWNMSKDNIYYNQSRESHIQGIAYINRCLPCLPLVILVTTTIRNLAVFCSKLVVQYSRNLRLPYFFTTEAVPAGAVVMKLAIPGKPCTGKYVYGVMVIA